MGIKLSAVSKKPPVLTETAARLRAAFGLLLGFMVRALRTIFLPHLFFSVVLFGVSCAVLYKNCLSSLSAPFSLFVWVLIGSVYGTLAIGYALAMSVVFALRAVAMQVEDFLYALFESLKEKVRSRIDNMEEGVSKQQAKAILDNSIREILAPLKQLRVQSFPQLAAAVLLSVLTFVTRAVFVARLGQLASNSVQLSAVFAGRATLVGALFLNLRWLSALALWFLYAVGFGFFILNIGWLF